MEKLNFNDFVEESQFLSDELCHIKGGARTSSGSYKTTGTGSDHDCGCCDSDH